MILCCLTGGQLCVRAEESSPTFCPDLHEHKAVLEEGLRYYDENKSHPKGRSGGYSENLDLYMNSSFDDRWFQADWEPSEKELDSYKVTSEADPYHLCFLADRCLFYGKFSKAFELFSQLQKIEEGKKGLVATPQLIRMMAWTKLLCGCDDPLIPQHGQIPKDHCLALNFDSTGRQQIIQSNLIKKITQSGTRAENPDWLEALELYQRSSDLRTPGYPARISDEVIRALLLEWNEQVKESKDVLLSNAGKYFKDNSTLKLGTDDALSLSGAIVGFCQRQNDIELAHLMESRISSKDTEIAGQLLAFYGAGHYCDEAVRLFRKITNDFDATKYAINGITLNGVGTAIPCLSDSDAAAIKTLVDSNLKFRNFRDSQYLLPILKKADEKGWHAFPGSVYRTYTKNESASGESPEVLSVFVDFFVETKDYNLALAALNRSLGVVKRHPNAWMSLDDKFLTASKLKEQASAPWVMRTATGGETIKEATALVEYLSRLVAQRECLSVAADLDATAEKLEERDLFAKAEQLYRESVQIKKKNLGPNHIETVSSLVALARVLSLQDKCAEATSTYAEALTIYNANKSFRDRSYGDMLESYAQVLVKANRTAQADKVYAEAREFYRTR